MRDIGVIVGVGLLVASFIALARQGGACPLKSQARHCLYLVGTRILYHLPRKSRVVGFQQLYSSASS